MLDCAVSVCRHFSLMFMSMFVPSDGFFFGNLGEKRCIYFLLPRIKLIDGEVVLLPPSASSHACKQTGSQAG